GNIAHLSSLAVAETADWTVYGTSSDHLNQASEQRCPSRNIADYYVLVLGVSTCTIDTQSVQHRNTKRRDKVSVRSSSNRSFLEFEPDLSRQRLGLFE